MPETPSAIEQARAALRSRQGLGARYDDDTAPARELDWARRGTAYFARKMNELSDADLDAESRVPGWGRRQVAACVGYHARALARVVERARTGAPLELWENDNQRDEEIEDGKTLPAGALRHLVDHAQVHLNVEWRDLDAAGWDKDLPFAGIPTARSTPWLRAKEIWLRAIDLRNGGTFEDCPPDFLAELLTEHTGMPGSEVNLASEARSLIHPSRNPY